MLDYTIRPAVPTDLDSLWPAVVRAVAAMRAEGNTQWGDDYPISDDYAEDIGRGELIVAAAPDGRVLGAACASVAPEPLYVDVDWTIPAPAMVVHRMVVDPEVQRGGVARALFQYAEDRARTQGVPTIHADTSCKNEKMQRLFQKLGFVRRGEIHIPGRPLLFPVFEKLL